MMSQDNSILNLLEIKDPNIQTSAVEDQVQDNLHFKEVSAILTYQADKCPFCTSTQVVKNGTRPTTLKLPAVVQKPVHLGLRRQRYLCRACHKTFSAETQIVQCGHSITRQAEQVIHALAQESLPIKTISKITGISASSIQRILYKDKEALVKPHQLPTALSFDEFRSVKGQFSFICIDAKTHELVALFSNRLTKTITEYFTNTYSLTERQEVKLVTMDLNAQYQQFVHRIFPNAAIVFDRFHIVQLVGGILDRERVKSLKSLADHRSRTYKALKHQWRLFHKDETELDGQTVKYYPGLNEYTTAQNVVDIGLEAFPKFKEVYRVYQAVIHFVRQRDQVGLQALVMNYQPTHTEMDTAVRTITKNYLGIQNACSSEYSNGGIEGVNRKIKELKRSCYGFRNIRHFFIRIKLIRA